MMAKRLLLFSFLVTLNFWRCAVAKDIAVGNVSITYSGLLEPRCEMFFKHAVGPYPKGEGVGDWCSKYVLAKNNDLVNYISGLKGEPPVAVHKGDYISLDDFPEWHGVPPIRARFSIGARREVSDPDVAPSYLPYGSNRQVADYMKFDEQGYEIDLKSSVRTGYRFYEFLGRCFLATVKKPRVYKYLTECESKHAYEGFPKSVDTTGHPWINVMDQNTVDLNERMPADSVEIPGSNPVKPLIYPDYPIGDDGRVTKGRAMCMADCPSGMLMKLLHARQSIWGPSGKPPAVKQ